MTGACSALRSARLDMEPLRREHAAETWAYLKDERMWTHFPHLRPASLEQVVSTYEHRIRNAPDPGLVRWENWICRERASGNVIGDLQTTIYVNDGAALVAYGVYLPFQRRGFGREAVGTLLTHLREAHGVKRTQAEIGTANAPSIALVESLGFHRSEQRDDEFLYELLL